MKKTRTMLCRVLSIAVCCHVMLVLAMGAPFKTSEERIPKEVKRVVKKQTKAYFGKQKFTGVPLLDPKIEWNDFANWPDEFTFRGETNSIQISELVSDYSRNLKSRCELKPGMRFLVTYYNKGSSKKGSLVLYGCWLKNGSINEKWVLFNQQTVYHYLYSTSGRILRFARDDYATKEHRCEYFDQKGKAVGFWSTGRSAGFVWEGRKVDIDAFGEYENKFLTYHLWTDPAWSH